MALHLMAAGKLDSTGRFTYGFSLDHISEEFAIATGRESYGSVKVLVCP